MENEDELECLKADERLASDHVFLIDSEGLSEDLKKSTSGRGVDLILGSQSRDMIRFSWKCLVNFGKYADVGIGDLSQLNKADIVSFLANRTFHCVDLASLAQHLPTEIGR